MHNLIGRGGFARVYRAKSLVTGQEVAIKMVSDRKIYTESRLQRVKMQKKSARYSRVLVAGP